MNTIEIIQGDTLDLEVSILGLEEYDLVNNIYFTSEKLGIKKELTKISNDTFILNFTSEETKNLQKGIYSYDLTIYFNEEKVDTTIYNGSIIVFEKENKI